MVPAPTVRTHGASFRTLPRWGPRLPAAQLTKIPLSTADRVAMAMSFRWNSPVGSVMARQITSTRSLIASSMAATRPDAMLAR
ncbi:unnamed protein product [Spirodela intermedia]|uniref:Uncharacterized protein n=2 Tax=Spirodela intermedia TaxID=51605 RepID=A0A7I8KE52_SPIIN|nr:unnamed protein product [Spirodela intermedia]CAA6659076.1 unnamed protein product [Spirodela intermedia]CAA7395368.1 unnamed protein product [Spirodela intermedia]